MQWNLKLDIIIFALPSFSGHESLVFWQDSSSLNIPAPLYGFLTCMQAFQYCFPSLCQISEKTIFAPAKCWARFVHSRLIFSTITLRCWSGRSWLKRKNASKVRSFHYGQLLSGMAREQCQYFELVLQLARAALMMIIQILLKSSQPNFGHFAAFFSARQQHGQSSDCWCSFRGCFEAHLQPKI